MYSVRSLMMSRVMETVLLVVLCVSGTVLGGCSGPCSCPPSPPLCPLGVSWVLDECGCCKVCAQQFNQDCGPDKPCDHIKGLYCHLQAGGDPHHGLCRADAQGRPCEFGGEVYQHGEDFQPSCEHQCSCVDGVVGCMPLCPQHLPLPSQHCAHPRLHTTPGGCCQEWVCDHDNRIREDSAPSQHSTNHIRKDSTPSQHSTNQLREDLHDSSPLQHNTNHIRKDLKDSAPSQPNTNQLRKDPTPAQHSTSHIREDSAPSHLFTNHISKLLQSPNTHRDDTFQEWVRVSLPSSQCFPQTTHWSSCSTSCGFGISSRVTNNNPECRLIRETRLCKIRDCDLSPDIRRGRRCRRTVRSRTPQQISFSGCSTVRRFRSRSCGFCVDGRCCRPAESRTLQLRFYCPDGEVLTHTVLIIQSCSCRKSFCRDTSSPAVSLHNDIHTYTS